MVVARPDAPVPSPAPIVFFGTPAFAVPTLVALAEDDRFAVRLVVTQPPRPSGRGRMMHRSAVHESADARGIPVLAPERLRDPVAVDRIAGAHPVLAVVAAFGKILRPEMLAVPDRGTLNVHASLLPAYRGASPINAAILDGVPETGVSIMLMDVGLDTGPVLAQATMPIPGDATTASLTEILAALGARLLIDTAAAWLNDAIEATPQDDARASVTRLIKKDDGAVDWHQPAARIARMERAYHPWPGVFTYLGGKRILLHGLTAAISGSPVVPGTVVALDSGGMRVRADDADVLVASVQPEGKPPMAAAAFANGRPGLIGSRLG
jgi:methionyl-tRNA formyltransferase